jgi:putative flippase GtrA
MIKLISKFCDKFPFMTQFIKFGLVGLSNTAISYGTYSLLVFLGVYYILASVIAFVVSVCNSFYWNNKYVFSSHDNKFYTLFRKFIKTFIAYASTGLLLQNILLWTLVEYFHISEYLAPLLILVVTVPLNFILNKYWAFRDKRYEKN